MKKFSASIKFFIIPFVILLIIFKVGDELDFKWKSTLPFFNTNEYASEHIYVLDRGSGEVIYEKNAQTKAYPASLTKIMTTIVALENIDDLSEIAPIDIDTYRQMVANNASMAGFLGNETVTYRDLLYGTILSSGGEAANSLAIHVAGNVESFVEMMNAKATELGLHHTHFTNPEGLHHKKQYTSATDMAKLLDYALDNGDFRAIFTKDSFKTTATIDHPEGILLESTVLSHLHSEEQLGFRIIGGKSGTTYEAGQCWATLGLVNDQEYISIVMGAPLKDISQPDRAQIADTLELFAKIKTDK